MERDWEMWSTELSLEGYNCCKENKNCYGVLNNQFHPSLHHQNLFELKLTLKI